MFSLIILILFASTFALAQNNDSDKGKDKGGLAPLAAEAPLADVQDWLIKALNKNFGYSTTDDSA